MMGKKDNYDIFNEYKQVLLEQAESNEFLSLINKIKACSLDQASKDKLIEIIKAQMAHGIGDADAAGYASYPDAKPAQDMDEEEKPRKFNYQTGRYEGETDRERYERSQRDAKVLGSFSR